jgi:hypothetical protein
MSSDYYKYHNQNKGLNKGKNLLVVTKTRVFICFEFLLPYSVYYLQTSDKVSLIKWVNMFSVTRGKYLTR